MNIPFIPRSPEYVALAKQRDDEMIVRTAPTDAVRDARRALVARLVYDEQPWPVGEELQKLLWDAEAMMCPGHILYMTTHPSCVHRGRM